MKSTLTLAPVAGLNHPVCPECKTAHKTGEPCPQRVDLFSADAPNRHLRAVTSVRVVEEDAAWNEKAYRDGLVTNYVIARSTGATDAAIGIVLDAMDLDAARPGQPRLMDEIRSVELEAAA